MKEEKSKVGGGQSNMLVTRKSNKKNNPLARGLGRLDITSRPRCFQGQGLDLGGAKGKIPPDPLSLSQPTVFLPDHLALFSDTSWKVKISRPTPGSKYVSYT